MEAKHLQNFLNKPRTLYRTFAGISTEVNENNRDITGYTRYNGHVYKDNN